jgi:hypothetical protein
MRSGLKIGMWAVATIVAALWTSSVEAGFVMTVSETDGHTTTSGTGVALTPNSVVFIGLLGNATLDMSTAVEMVSPAEVYADLFTFANVPVQPPAPVTLTVTLTLTDLTLSTWSSPTLVDLTLTTNGAAQPGESVALSAALDTSDLGRTSGSGVSTISYSSGPGTFSTLGSAPSTLVSLAGAPQTNPFSVSLVETIQFSAPGAVVLNSSVDPSVPEPSTLMLLAGGLPLVGFGSFRRREKTVR